MSLTVIRRTVERHPTGVSPAMDRVAVLHSRSKGSRGSVPFVIASQIISLVSNHQRQSMLCVSRRSRSALSKYSKCGSLGIFTSVAVAPEKRPLWSVATSSSTLMSPQSVRRASSPARIGPRSSSENIPLISNPMLDASSTEQSSAANVDRHTRGCLRE